MFNAIILGIIQGLTEFLPVSSSGHVLVFEKLLNYSQTDKGFVVAIHLATFFAAVFYFHKDVFKLIKGLVKYKSTEPEDVLYKNLAYKIIIGTIPVFLIGYFIDSSNYMERLAENLYVIGISSLIFTGVLYYADKRNLASKTTTKEISYKNALLISVAQLIAAVFPGASRSGVTLSTSFLRNIDRETATKFVFLLSLPITLIAPIYEIFVKGNISINGEFFAAFIAAFASGLIAIHYLLYFIRKKSLIWLCLYRVLFGVGVIIFALYTS
jgi:undecaprenyl-diphosphatase